MMESLQQTLYQISNALLIPTLVALLGLGAWMVLLVGGLIRETLGRPAVRRALTRGMQDRGKAIQHLSECNHGVIAHFMRLETAHPGQRDKALETLEIS